MDSDTASDEVEKVEMVRMKPTVARTIFEKTEGTEELGANSIHYEYIW